jgi:hypothetical protein
VGVVEKPEFAPVGVVEKPEEPQPHLYDDQFIFLTAMLLFAIQSTLFVFSCNESSSTQCCSELHCK